MTPTNNNTGKITPEQLHNWYLEACQKKESGFEFNPKAQEPYELLSAGQKFLDKYIADKVNQTLKERESGVIAEIRKMKYKDRDFLGEDMPEMAGMRMRNLVLDQIIDTIQAKAKENKI